MTTGNPPGSRGMRLRRACPWVLSCVAGLGMMTAGLSRSSLREVLPLYAGSIFLTSIVASGCVGLGDLVLRAFRIRLSTLQRVAFSFGLGEGILGLSVFVMGLVQGLGERLHYPLLVLLGVLGYLAVQDFRKRDWGGSVSSPLPGELGLATVAALGGLGLLLIAWVPPFEYDVLGYHLALPKRWIQMGRIAWTPDNVYACFPSLVEMFFYLGLLWKQEIFANLWIVMNVLALCGLFRTNSKDAMGRLGWTAPAVLLTCPLVWLCGGSAYNDMPLTFFSCLGLVALNRALAERSLSWALLAGLFAGFAMGTKYHGFLIWGVLLISGAWSGRAQRPWRALAWFSLSAWMCASPWLIRNLVWTGNPFFPLLTSLLGGGMSEAHGAAFAQAHSAPPLSLGSLWAGLGAASWTLAGSLALLPLLLSFEGRARFRAANQMAIPCLIMMGASWLFFMNRTERFLALPVVLFALWTGSSLTGEGRVWVRARRLAAVLCGVNLAINVAASESIGLWTVSIGGQSRDAFLESHVQCYFISKIMSQALSGSQKALLVGEARTYPFDVPVATSYPFSAPPIVAAMQESQTAEDLWRGLTRRGFSHVLLNISSSERLSGAYDYFHPYERVWEDPVFTEFLDDFCSKICEDRGGDIQLYALKGASGGEAGEVSSSQGG